MQMNRIMVATAAALSLAAVGCTDTTGPQAGAEAEALVFDGSAQRAEGGTGLVLEDVTGVELPLIGDVGGVVVDQAVITRFVLVEDVAGNIVGLRAEGVLRLTGGVLGTDVVTQDFTTDVLVASSGPGNCRVLTVDLGPTAIEALGDQVSVDVPQAEVTARGSGAVGPLLCALGRALQPPVGGVTNAARGLVNAINNVLI